FVPRAWPRSPVFPYTTLFRSVISWGVYRRRGAGTGLRGVALSLVPLAAALTGVTEFFVDLAFSPVKWAGVAVAGLAVVLYLASGDRKSTRLNSSHVKISYAVF